jgi:hypothetical protein
MTDHRPRPTDRPLVRDFVPPAGPDLSLSLPTITDLDDVLYFFLSLSLSPWTYCLPLAA